MPKVASSPLPTTVTTAQLAHALGLAERNIASRRMDGRLRIAEDGHIDLRAVLRAGIDAMARRPGRAASDPAEDRDAELRTAAHATAHLMLTRFLAAPSGADLGAVAAGALREALDLFGVAGAEDAAIPDRLEPLAGTA